MKKLLIILLLLTTCANAQIFRFSTIYGSFSTGSPFVENQQFLVNGVAGSGQLVEVTQVNEPNYNFTIGIRKIARFDYQVKMGRFYTGSENEISDYATISNADGLEYLFEYSTVRNRGMEFVQEEYKMRYLHDNSTFKVGYVNDGVLDLKYTQAEARYRKSFGNLDLTVGVAHRSHPVYGYSPVEAWFADPANKHWWQLANEFNYFSTENGEWAHITDEGEYWVAESDYEFYTYHFGRAVNSYNKRELDALGLQQELSAVIGADYYLNGSNYWIHSWASIYPIHKGLSEYSYEYEDSQLEWDTALIVGSKVNNHLGLFLEGRHLKFWGIKSYELRAGINYLIF